MFTYCEHYVWMPAVMSAGVKNVFYITDVKNKICLFLLLYMIISPICLQYTYSVSKKQQKKKTKIIGQCCKFMSYAIYFIELNTGSMCS